MTREEAIQVLKEISTTLKSWSGFTSYPQAIDMAIEALTEPSKVDYRTDESANIGTKVNDLISRADAIEVVEKEDCLGYIECKAEKIYDRINELPSAEAVSREFYEDAVKANHGLAKENSELKEQIESADRPINGKVRYKLKKPIQYVTLEVEDNCVTHIGNDVIDSLNDTIKSAEPSIVRCKDCKWWQDNNNGYPVADCKWNREETPDADDFCSCGERREDGEA